MIKSISYIKHQSSQVFTLIKAFKTKKVKFYEERKKLTVFSKTVFFGTLYQKSHFSLRINFLFKIINYLFKEFTNIQCLTLTI